MSIQTLRGPSLIAVLFLLVMSACGGGGDGTFVGSGVSEESLRAMWDAVQSNDLQEVQRLLQAEPGLLNAERDDAGSTPLSYALVYQDDDLAIAEYLLTQGADPNVANKNGWTLLHGAVYNHHLPQVELLLEYGADPSLKTPDGETALDLARRYGGREPIEEALQRPR